MDHDSAELSILVIESDPDHRQILVSTLDAANAYRVVTAANGNQALDILYRREPNTAAAYPNLILLSLNPANAEEIQVLTAIKSDARLKRIPIIVLASSDTQDHILRCYELQGNCYIVRPTDTEQLTKIIKQIETFWLNVVTLPEVANH